jgi:hypothetical protein
VPPANQFHDAYVKVFPLTSLSVKTVNPSLSKEVTSLVYVLSASEVLECICDAIPLTESVKT